MSAQLSDLIAQDSPVPSDPYWCKGTWALIVNSSMELPECAQENLRRLMAKANAALSGVELVDAAKHPGLADEVGLDTFPALIWQGPKGRVKFLMGEQSSLDRLKGF